jgi:hypothetical protein
VKVGAQEYAGYLERAYRDELTRRPRPKGQATEKAPTLSEMEAWILSGIQISDDGGFSKTFDIDAFRRTCLLEGLDNIALSLKHIDQIAAWEAAHGLPAVTATGG